MKIIILKYLVMSYKNNNIIVYFLSILFCSYTVCFVAKSNKFMSPNTKPNLHIPNTFSYSFNLFLEDVLYAI